VVFILEGAGTLVCDGKSYTVSQGDAVLVPPNAQHQWRNETQSTLVRATFNPVASEAHEH
jgi:mannose-6-phosphate isomerase-like protein (cupin superfamily)